VTLLFLVVMIRAYGSVASSHLILLDRNGPMFAGGGLLLENRKDNEGGASGQKSYTIWIATLPCGLYHKP